jgi:2-polyprenyl-6-methoxyphenol hydroxylase-like FAD-dependent oxidoreductase
MTPNPDVCIRGAGIVGRTLALLLARAGLHVALVAPAERNSATTDVRAYSIGAGGKALLEGLRCWPAEAHATPVLAMQVQGDRNGAVHFDAVRQGLEALNWIVDVPELERLLRTAVDYQGAIDVVAAPVATPLTVVCEGRASATRAELGIEFSTVPYAQRAIATRLDCERPHQQIARQWFGAEGDVLAFLPLAGANGKAVAVVWSAPTEQAIEADGWDDATLAAKLHDLSQDALGALAVQGARGTWPLELAEATHWIGRVPGREDASFALAGDAAHALHPLAGLGLNLGLGDAAELARVLAARERWRSLSDRHVLRRYERARRNVWLRTRLATDGLQRLFAHPAPAVTSVRNWGLQWFDRCAPAKTWAVRLATRTV